MKGAPYRPSCVADRARQTAAGIRALPNTLRELVRLRPPPTSDDVRRRINLVKLEVDFFPVAILVASRFSPAHKDELVLAIGKIVDSAQGVLKNLERIRAQHESNEADGLSIGLNPSMVVECSMVAEMIEQYAARIDELPDPSKKRVRDAGAGGEVERKENSMTVNVQGPVNGDVNIAPHGSIATGQVCSPVTQTLGGGSTPHWLARFWRWLVGRIPVVGKVYGWVKEK